MAVSRTIEGPDSSRGGHCPARRSCPSFPCCGTCRALARHATGPSSGFPCHYDRAQDVVVKRLRMRQTVRVGPFNGVLNGKADDYMSLTDTAEENRVAVIRAATILEDSLAEAAIAHFCPSHPNRKISMDFRAFVVGTSWCTFEGKRQLLCLILDRLQYKTPKWRKDFEKITRTVINFRNAFTHGIFITNGVEVRLQWFSGHPQSQTLTDDWLTTVEARLDEALDQADEIVSYLRQENPSRHHESEGSGI